MTTRYNNSDSEKRTQTTPTTIGQASPPMPCSWMTFRTSCGPGVVRTLGTRMLARWCVRVCVCVCVLYGVGGTRVHVLSDVRRMDQPPTTTYYVPTYSFIPINTHLYLQYLIHLCVQSISPCPSCGPSCGCCCVV
jgi:hypothetical protein